MMMQSFLKVLTFLSFLVLSAPGLAEDIYDSDLTELSGTLRALMVRSEHAKQIEPSTRLKIQSELFDLSKKLHRLQEEASGADVDLMRSGRNPNRQLQITAAVCQSLDLAATLTASYLDTFDNTFWLAAVQAALIARNLQAKK